MIKNRKKTMTIMPKKQTHLRIPYVYEREREREREPNPMQMHDKERQIS